MDTSTPILTCPSCNVAPRKHGKDAKGNQRYQCPKCLKTVSDVPAGPLGHMRLPLDKAVQCLQLIVEGSSLRTTTRIAKVNLRTVINLLVMIGERCEAMLEGRINGISVVDVQVDELWGFVGEKEKTRLRKHPERIDTGDAYCFTALERHTKLMLAWHLGTRTPEDTAYFSDKLALATAGKFQISTDGFTPYATAIPNAMPQADFAQIIKQFSSRDDKKEGRYSPGVVIGTVKVPRHGSPDMAKVCTSHIERHNLTIRMGNRRLTRLTNAFSKKWANHQASLALTIASYNFCRPHQTLTDATASEDKPKRKTTPAMAAGLVDHPWTLEELVRNTMAA